MLFIFILSFSCVVFCVLGLFYYLKTQKIQLDLFIKTQSENNLQQQLNQVLQDIKIYQEQERKLPIIETQLQSKKDLLNEKEKEINELKQQKDALNKENTKLQVEKSELQEKLNNTKENDKKWQETLELQFTKIINQNSENLTTLNQQKITEVLNPFNKDLKNLQDKLDQVGQENKIDRAVLKENIENLFNHTNKISIEANNLTSALKGGNKIQGNWGEMLLEQILQHSGLQRDLHYKKELNIKNEEGKNLRPDFQIFLPDGSIIITDSKVSLNSYNDFINTGNEQYLEAHLSSLDQHIKGLAKKEYDKNIKQALDFTIAFIPVEPAYLLVMQHKPKIWLDAYEKKILLTSPSNFVACLKIIQDIWQRYKREENYQEIKELALRIYEKSVGFLEDFQEIGKALKKADDCYVSATKKFVDGKGNLVDKLEQFKDKGGINSSKKIPEFLM